MGKHLGNRRGFRTVLLMAAALITSLSVAGNMLPAAAGGSVRFYGVKTLIQANVYADDAATQVLTQPISLDAYGRTTVPVYATAPVRAIIFSSSGAQVQDVERIDGDRAELVAIKNTQWPNETSVDAALTALGVSLGATDGRF